MANATPGRARAAGLVFCETPEHASVCPPGVPPALAAKQFCSLSAPGGYLISQNVSIRWISAVSSPAKLSTCCLLLLIKTISCRFCGGVDFLKPFN